MRKRFAAMLVLPFLVACAQPSQSAAAAGDTAAVPVTPPAQGGAQQVTVELTQAEGRSSAGEDHEATAQGAPGGAVVRGVISAPNPCHRLAGTADRAGDTVTLRVAATADPDAMCIQSIGSIPYTATLRGLPAGTYTLRVVHTYPETGWDTATALETRFTAG